ncbi:MAG: hypothetical protein FWH41_01605 [Treponema sp.]|nr:hypothetical protein [Treponema sp.]
MIIETPHENIELTEPVVKPVEIPEKMRPFSDKWGNIITKPIDVISENHGPHFIQVSLYAVNNLYFYGYQLKIKKLVFQKRAKVTDRPEETERDARRAAQNELFEIVNKQSKKALDVFLIFDKICYNQPELF